MKNPANFGLPFHYGMMRDNMSENNLRDLLLPQETVEQGDIHIAKGIAERTVWDVHATENPAFAVISAADDATAKEKSKGQLEDMKQYLTPEMVLLDFGSGYGRVAELLLPEFPLEGYIGMDSSLEMLQLFKQRYVRSDEEQKTPLLLLNADIHTVPLKDASVDAVIVCAVFLHNHKDVVKKAMAELKRVVKPGGVVLVYSSFPRVATAMGVQGTIYQFLLNLMGKPFKNGPVRYYSRREILELFKDFSEFSTKSVGFSFLPKTLVFLPSPLEVLYRNIIANPINKLLEKVCPTSVKTYFAVHYDVIATR
jgi:ubiquinone/menaquinone biosynthesis C-methylase UbiE